VHLFEEMVTALPPGLYFRSVQRQGDVVTIDGTSESNPRISSLMRSLDDQDHYRSPNLRSVTETDAPDFGAQASDFRMTVNVEVPTAQNQEGGG
jgi:type IV pilus assembly protein PilN